MRVATRHFRSDKHFYQRYNIEAVPTAIRFPVQGDSGDIRRALAFGLGAFAAVILTLVFHLAPRFAIILSQVLGFPGFAYLALADTVVLCGGGYLYSPPPGRFSFTLVHCAMIRWLAYCLRKPMVMMPQSVGPLVRRRDEAIVTAALRPLTRIVVREEESLTAARDLLGDRREIVVCPDIALMGWPKHESSVALPERPRHRNSVGVIAMDWTWARGASRHRFEQYLDKMTLLTTRLDQRGYLVSLMASSRLPSEQQDDLAIAREILDRSFRFGAENACIDTSADDVDGLRAALGNQSVVLSTRLHGCLIAMVEGRPAIALAYQPKTNATYNLLGLDDLCLDVEAFSAQDAFARVEAIADDLPRYQRRISDAVHAARKDILLTLT